MGEVVVNNKDYLNKSLDAIKTNCTNGLNKLDIKTNSYSSTTNVPSKEPMLIEQLLKVAKELYEKIVKDLDNIRSVGEGFQTMDNFLADQSIDLGFQVQSFQSTIVDLSEFAATSLDTLMEKEIPIIAGYTDIGKTDDDDGKKPHYIYTGPTGPTDTPPTPTPKTEPTTTAKTEPKTEAKTEAKTTPATDPKTEPKTEVETTPKTDPKTEPTTTVVLTEPPIKTEPKTEAAKPKPKPTGGGGGESEKTTPTPTVEIKTEASIIDEPIIEDTLEMDTFVEPTITEEPIIDEPMDYEDEITLDDQIIDIDDNYQVDTTSKKSGSGKAVGAVIAGLGLAAGAGVVGYNMYKKSKEDKEYEDYGYEDDGGEA